MSTVVKELLVKFAGDTTGLDTAVKAATKAIRMVSTTVKLTAGAAAAVAAALSALTVKQMQAADAAAKLADSLGISLTKFQAISLVAEEAGIDQGKLAQSITITQRAIEDAAQGGEAYGKAFRLLNLNAREMINLSPDQQFEMLAGALSKVENDTQRTAIAMEIFGRGGRDVINMLDGFGAKVEEARAFNDKFNITLSRVDASMIEEANDTFARLGKAIGGLGNTLAVELSPLITAVSNALLNAGIDGESFGKLVGWGMEVASAAIDLVRKAIAHLEIIYTEGITEIKRIIADLVEDVAEMDEVLVSALNKIPGVALEASHGIRDFADELRKSADIGEKKIEGLKSKLENFESTATKIAKIQADARKRAESAVSGRGAGGGFVEDIYDPKKVKAYEEALKKAREEQLRLNNAMADSFIAIKDGFTQGGSFAENFRKTVLNVINDVANNLIRLSFNGTANQGLGGGIASALFGAFGGGGQIDLGGAMPWLSGGSAGGGLGGILGGIGGLFGFAKGGSFTVGGDGATDSGLVAFKATRGEQVTVTKPGQSASGSGQSVVVNQSIQIGTSVSAAVRQEVARMLPDIKRATISGVEDARLRGAMV